MTGWMIAALVVLGLFDLPALWREGGRRESVVWLIVAVMAVCVLVLKSKESWYLADWLLGG